MAIRDFHPFEPSSAGPADRPKVPAPEFSPEVARGADQYDIRPPARNWPLNGDASSSSSASAWQAPDPKSLPPLHAQAAGDVPASNIHAPEDMNAPADLESEIRTRVGGLAVLLCIRVVSRVIVYLLAVWCVSAYPWFGMTLYALVLSDFLFHFGHAIIFGSMSEGMQAWLGLGFASLMGWMDPNGWFGMGELSPFDGRTMGFVVAILVLIRVSILATFSKGPGGRIQIWAEEGPNYRPKETLWFRGRRWISFLWRLM